MLFLLFDEAAAERELYTLIYTIHHVWLLGIVAKILKGVAIRYNVGTRYRNARDVTSLGQTASSTVQVQSRCTTTQLCQRKR